MSKDKQFEVSTWIEEDREILRAGVEKAFNNRTFIEKEPTKIVVGGNTVVIQEEFSHLYPFLLEEDYKKIGLTNKISKPIRKLDLEHEYTHGTASPKQSDLYYGVAFYRLKGEDVVQPFTTIVFKEGVEKQEILDFALAPSSPSASDKELADNAQE
jgi:hypothetical protein